MPLTRGRSGRGGVAGPDGGEEVGKPSDGVACSRQAE